MTRYIDQLNENTGPVGGDYLLCYQASAGATDKDRKVNVNKFAVLANAQSFTGAQTFAPANTAIDAVTINMPTSSAGYALNIQFNGTRRIDSYVQSGASVIEMLNADFGSNAGPLLWIGRNSNASTPAAACLQLMARTGTAVYYWTDNAGNLRLSTSAAPTNSTDTGGTVVGTQTSSLDSKNVVGDACSPLEALRSLCEAATNALRKFTYKSGAFNGEVFDGLVVDYAPRYGMDRDAAHPAGKSLNVITLLGDLVQAVAYLSQRVETLEGAK